nr:MAG TPA: hypothetical protein [Caudoviricetes sp.]
MAGTLVRVEGVRPSAGTRSLFMHCGGRGILAILSRVRVTHSPCVQGYKRVQYQRNGAASAGVQERTINARLTHDKHTAMRRKSFAYRRV